jgi:hypothetical protein
VHRLNTLVTMAAGNEEPTLGDFVHTTGGQIVTFAVVAACVIGLGLYYVVRGNKPGGK